MKHNNRKRNRCGAALVLAVCMVIILALIGIGLIRLGQNARMQAVRDVMKISARSAADAGLEHAVRYMIDSWNGETNKPLWVNTTWYDATEWPDPATPATAIGYSFGPIDLGGTYGEASFVYDIYKGTRANGYQIISTGTAGGTTRIVHAAVVLRSVFFGIGAKEDIYLSPNLDLGTVPEGGPFIIQTNSIKDNVITLKPGITVPGDVVCGPGGDPDSAIDTGSNVTIDGEAKAAEDYIDFPSIYVPNDLSVLPYGSVTIDPSDLTLAYIDGHIKLADLLIGTGSLADVETLEIRGDIRIFVDGFTELKPNTTILVTAGSSLDLYLGGDMQAEPGSEITYEGMPVDPDPVAYENLIIEAAEAISIKGTVAADGTPLCTDIELKPNNDFFGAIYAPDASLQLEPGGDFYGAIVGSGTIELKPGGTFMFIPSLVDLDDVEVLYMGVKHGSWWEE